MVLTVERGIASKRDLTVSNQSPGSIAVEGSPVQEGIWPQEWSKPPVSQSAPVSRWPLGWSKPY